MPDGDADQQDLNVQIENNNSISLLWPFLTGAFFLLLIVGIVAFGDEPTPAQFLIYRTVIALGGAGFAVTLTGQLEIAFPIFRRGSIKAAAAFAVFVILYFFTPASLLADEGERQSLKLIEDYKDQNSSVGMAANALGRYWDDPTRFAALARAAGYRSDGQDRVVPEESDLQSALELIKQQLGTPDGSQAFSNILSFHEEVFDCVDSGTCDTDTLCSPGTGLFQDIERFRNLYCGPIIERSQQLNLDLWDKYLRFSVEHCRSSFLMEYIRFTGIHEVNEVCIPIQCWATNMTRPYPCEVRRQLVGGVMLPI
jgi:hypothetical protein